MEQKEPLNNEEERQNVEEEEYDEEDEEEKETNKEDNDKKNEEKDKENKVELQKENEKENINKELKEEEQKDKKIEEKESIEPKEEKKVEKEQISTTINKQNNEEKVENIEEKEGNKEDLDKKEIPQINKEENNLLIDKKDNNENKDNVNNNNNKEENKKEIIIKDENKKDEKNIILDKKENGKKKEEELEVKEEEKEEEIKDSVSTYILKYTRKSNEPRESSYDKELIKTKHCLFMIEFKILKGKKEKFLLIYCHEIAAIYFDEIYEKKYSLNDLYKENRHFRIFDDIEEAKKVVDEILNTNNSNTKKIFIDLQENNFRLHLNITFFDKENEVIFNVPKKTINDKERIRLLPQFLKEIQIKMNHLEEDNKRLKNENKNMSEGEMLNNAGKMNLSGDGDNDSGSKNDISQNIKKMKSGNGKGYKKKLIKK